VLRSVTRKLPTHSKKATLFAIFIMAIGFFLRYIPVAHLHFVSLYGDMVHYDHAAVTLINHNVYSYWGITPGAQVTPGYPIFLMLIYRLANLMHHSAQHQVQLHDALLAQVVLSTASICLVYLLARRILSPIFSLIAMFLWTIYPPAIWSTGLLLTETLYVFFLLCFLCSFTIAMEKKTRRWWFLAGLSLGLTGIVRPTVFPLLLAALIYLLWTWKERKFQLSAAKPLFFDYLAHAVGFVLILFPWWIRNLLVLHRVILTDDDLGNPLLYGTDKNFQNDATLSHGLSAIQQEHLAVTRIQSMFSHHFWSSLQWYSLDKLQFLFATPWYAYSPARNATHIAFNTWAHLNIVWVVLGMVGLFVGLWMPKMRLLSWASLFFVLVQLPFIPINRYVFPLMPLFFIGTALILEQFFIGSIWRKRGKTS